MEKEKVIELKEFAIRVGKDILETLTLVILGIISFTLVMKGMEWFAGLWGYHL